MKYVKKHHLVFCLVLVGMNVIAQDKIYYTKKKTDDWKVTEISSASIKGSDVQNPKVPFTASPSDVLFVFNSLGNFLVIPGLYDNAIKADVYVRNFFLQVNPNFGNTDKIITEKNEIITGTYRLEKESVIEYTIGNKFLTIPKKEVALIIFRDGKHKLFANTDRAFKALKSVQDNYYQLAFGANGSPSVTRDSQAVAGKVPPADVNNETLSSSMSAPGKDSSSKSSARETPLSAGSGSNQEKPVNSNTPATKTAAVPPARDPGRGARGDIRLDSATMTSLQKKALLNIKELEGYIRLISAKDSDPDQVSRSVEQALSLFINEDATVEVSSVHRSDVQQYKVGVYLKRLGLLKYDKVVIEWYDVQYTSRLRKGADGNYYGFIEFEQRFTGLSGDNKVYEDITRKTVEIVLKTYEKRRGGETALEWDVFLGNIGIAVTKPS